MVAIEGNEPVQTGEIKSADGQFDLSQFNWRPPQLKAQLDRYIRGQDNAKRTLATAVCTHYRRLQYEEEHNLSSVTGSYNGVLLIGPTGCGKTAISRKIARIIGVPIQEQDATKLTESGYVGEDVEEIVRKLVWNKANGNIALAERGMIFIDEVDKLARPDAGGNDVKGQGVQEELYKLVEGTEMEIREAHSKDRNRTEVVNTSNMFFVFAGQFLGISDIIESRIKGSGIGFGKRDTKDETRESKTLVPTTDDLVAYGLDPQLVGRMGQLSVLSQLTIEDLHKILLNPRSDVMAVTYREFMANHVHVNFNDSAMRYIAEKALNLGVGARGLRKVIQEVTAPFLYELPHRDISDLVITKEMAEKPDTAVENLLKKRRKERAPRHQVAAEAQYQDSLRKLGLGNEYLAPAANYGLEQGMEPGEIPQVISGLHSDVDTYITTFNSGKPWNIDFDEEARTLFVAKALETRKEIKGIIDDTVKNYFDRHVTRKGAIVTTVTIGKEDCAYQPGQNTGEAKR
ncbi:AAA family ATPase [Candidatus Woesearchaeota archaeon]|nr:AAA family ATPase [Candidatus Woesearchaeota archaeon]